MTDAYIENKLSRFTPISLAEMEKVKLMNRTDIKYIMPYDNLCAFLTKIDGYYDVQKINDKRIQTYQTLYLDTADLKMFITHHNGHKKREKIRLRHYVNSNLVFLEIKDKDNKGYTNKTRLQLPAYHLNKDNRVNLFLKANAQFPAWKLIPHVETRYERITLVNKKKTERLTIDIEPGFFNIRTGRSHSFPKLVIIELKQEENNFSYARSLLSSLHIHPVRMSKYCIGSVMTNPAIKYNRFKPQIRLINKLINYQNGALHVPYR